MNAAAPLPTFLPRLGTILSALAALVARALLRDPFHAPLIVPLWNHIRRAGRLAERALTRFAAGDTWRARAPRPARPHGPGHPPIFPTGRAWLIRAIGYEAAGCASQLAALLAEPEAQAAFAACPAARRALAPVRHMLGLDPPRPRRPRKPRPKPAPPPRPAPPAWLLDMRGPEPKRPYWMPHRKRPPPPGGWENFRRVLAQRRTNS